MRFSAARSYTGLLIQEFVVATAKIRSSKTQHSGFFCSACGHESAKWQGQCPACHEWNTFVEAPANPPAGPGAAGSGRRHLGLAAVEATRQLSEISPVEQPRLPSGLAEFDRVLGGGLVPGSVVLIGGDPGIGKSTLLLQALTGLAMNQPVLYVSGEESADQVALRAHRLGVHESPMAVQAEIQLEAILASIDRIKPRIAVIDSIQTLYTETLNSAPGSVGQVRECAAQLTRCAKLRGTTILLVGHVTKDGSLAGPRVLEHIVDTVLYFEGDAHSSFRLVRAFKNRFGAINELGVFAMTDRGLKGVNNPSALFLSQAGLNVPGSCVMATQEGTRPLLVEIQALVDATHVPNPRRLTVGLEQNRLSMLLAVLHRHAGVACFDQDVFVNAVGGVRIAEPASDLPVLLSITSSLRDRPLPPGMVVFGEVGLTGEIRPAPRGLDRLREATKLGFTRAIVPQANVPKQPIEGLEIVGVSRLDGALEACRT